MSGEISVVPGFLFDEVTGETVTLQKLNKLVNELLAKIDAGAVSARELADGSISADKLDADIAAQLGGVADGSVTTAKLADLAVTTPKIADGAVTAAKLAASSLLPKWKAENSSKSVARSIPGGVTLAVMDLETTMAVTEGDIIEAWGFVDALNLNHWFDIVETGAGGVTDQLLSHLCEAISPTGSSQRQQVISHAIFEATSTGNFTANIRTLGRAAASAGTAYYRHLYLHRIANGRE
jgi:hypothetical protein